MTPKERAAMQQALEALLRSIPDEALLMYVPEEADEFHRKAITALREALAEPELNLSCKSVQKRLATVWGYVKAEQAEHTPYCKQAPMCKTPCGNPDCVEQAEQEPNYFGLTHDHTWLSIDKKQYDKLKPEGRMACYAAPVRTKDLTDIEDLQDAVTKALKKAFHLGQTYWQQADSESYAANKRAADSLDLYRKLEDDTRAVIAADREKNK